MKLLLILSTLFASAASSAALIEKKIEYKDKGKTFEGFLVYQEGKRKAPGILVVHNWMGLTDETKSKARGLAELGYVAFAADIYGKDQRPKDAHQAGELATKFKTDRKLYRERLNLALDQLRHVTEVDGKKLGAIGYCFGGTGAIELARSGADVKGVVSFHGGLDSPEPALGKKIKGKVLALHGADDPFEKPADLADFEAEMRNNKVDWQLVKFGGAVHSFTEKAAGNDNSKGAAYNEKADNRSWEMMKDFFGKEVF